MIAEDDDDLMTVDDGALPGLASARIALQDSYDRVVAAQ